MKRKSFLLKVFFAWVVGSFVLQPIFVFAQTATPTISQQAVDQYTSLSLLDQARKQCRSVVATGGVSSVFNDDGALAIVSKTVPLISSGAGNVASYDIAAIRQLNFIAAISSNIEALLKERNFSDDCFKVLAMANAQKGLVKQLKNTQKDVVDNDLNNPKKVAENINKKNLELSRDAVQNSSNPWKENIVQGIAYLSEPVTDDTEYSLDKSEVGRVTSGQTRLNRDNYYEIRVRGNNPYSQTVKTIEYIREKNSQDIGQVYDEARASGGIVASRKCTKTESGANPDETDFRIKDCIAWEAQPLIINQERIKQLVNAPYNQAFSPSAELGLDGSLSNLNTRINNGTLFSQSVGDNFGNLNTGTSTSLLDAEKIKNQLINPATSTPPGTVTLGILIHQAVADLYQSSTSSCIYVPITERQAVLLEAVTKKSELEAYKIDLTKKWAEVVAFPKLDYTNFFLKLSVDLANKYSKTWLEQLLTDAKDKASKCATAKANYTTASTTSPTVNLP